MVKILDDNIGESERKEFEEALAQSEKKHSAGALQSGEIVQIDSEFARIAIPGSKVEARLPIEEIKSEDGSLLFKNGDSIEVLVERGMASYKKAQQHRIIKEKIARLGENFKEAVIEAKVLRKAGRGFVLSDGEVEYYMPMYESALKDDPSTIGRKCRVLITSIDADAARIVVSRKKFLNVDAKRKKEVLAELMERESVDGVVSGITDFGVFVDIGGDKCSIEGLVPIRELSHSRGMDAKSNFAIGDKVAVKILKNDEERSRLTLSIRALTPDPWKNIEEELKVGYTIRGTVSKIMDFGAFVSVGNGIEAFLHISEIAWGRGVKVTDVLNIGDEINVEITEIDVPKRKIRVSLRNLVEKPFVKFIKSHFEGDVLKGKVVKVLDFGAFIELGSDGNKVDGLLKNEDVSWEKGAKAAGTLKEGEELEVMILRIDKVAQKLSLSKKHLGASPVSEFAKSVSVNSIVKGAVSGIKDFGVFVRIADGVEALIRNEDLSPLKKEELKMGDEIECAISSIDRDNNKVGASVRRLERVKEQENLKAHNTEFEKMTLGDRIKGL